MPDWEAGADPDAWKKDNSAKPWEDADGWKLEDGYKPGETEANRNPEVLRSLEYTVGIRPTVDITHLERDGSIPIKIIVKDRDALKLVNKIADLQKAVTEEGGELFQYSKIRNMWIRIPWDLVQAS